MIPTEGQFAGSALSVIQFGSSVGIAPVTVVAMLVKTVAAILVVTVTTDVKMVAAEILVAYET